MRGPRTDPASSGATAVKSVPSSMPSEVTGKRRAMTSMLRSRSSRGSKAGWSWGGRWSSAARKDLDSAIEIFEKLESRLELGRALVLRSEDEDLQRARELFEVCGAPADLANLS